MTKLRSAPRILVSLHDVWPGNYALIDRNVQWLREHGVSALSLLVVPCYHGRRPIDEESAFLEWLRAQIHQGATLFAHGYRHFAPEALGETIRRNAWGRWVNRRLQQEAEFAGLAEKDCVSLLERSLRHFQLSNLQPQGFAFPTWVGALPVAFRVPPRFEFVDGRFFVTDLQTRKRHWAPALTFGVSGGRRFDYGGWAWCEVLQRSKLMRISLHPGDLEDTGVRELVARFLRTGPSISYAMGVRDVE